MADIQTLVNNIPDAQDGNVITSDYHNTIKTALQAIAGTLAGTSSGQTVTVNVPVNFLPVAGSTPWSVKVGFAEDPSNSCDGWAPLTLPDGAVLRQLVAIGVKTSPATIGSVNLIAVPINGPTTNLNNVFLATINLAGVAIMNPFTISVPAQVTSALAGSLTVQNAQFKYVVEANVALSPAPASITLYAIQVTYTTP
ncbi:MAG: hypothetical protein ABSB35_25680 [Bryobacteraceae bacterium]|jgi:hypothetical protein